MRIFLAVVSLSLSFFHPPLPAGAAARLGLEGGVSATQFFENGLRPSSGTHDWRQELSGGAVLVVPCRPGASLVTGVRYDRKGGSGEVAIIYVLPASPRSTVSESASLDRRWTLDYLTIPLVLRVAKTSGIARPAFEFGPEVGILLGASVRYETLTGAGREVRERNIAGELNPVDLGMRMGIGLLIPDGPRLAFVRAGFVASFVNMKKAKSERVASSTYGHLSAFNRAAVFSAGLIF